MIAVIVCIVCIIGYAVGVVAVEWYAGDWRE